MRRVGAEAPTGPIVEVRRMPTESKGNKARQRAARKARLMARVGEHKERLQCADCPPGVEWPAVALDLDHLVPGDKVAGVSRLCRDGVAWPRVADELAKCEVVCASHHRIRTLDRGQF